MKIKVRDFVPLDVGSTSFTSIKPSGKQVVNMFTNRPHIMKEKLKQGLCHSHHNMGVFFSGTDTDTLLENASEYDMFLSIIVNNKGDIIAKVSRVVEVTITESYKYKFNFNSIFKEPETKTEEIIFIYDCKINFFSNDINKDIELIDEVLEEKRVLEFNKPSFSSSISFPNNARHHQGNLFNSFGDFDFNKRDISKKLNNNFNTINDKPKSIHDKVDLLIKSCIALDSDVEEIDLYTYEQCLETYKENEYDVYHQTYKECLAFEIADLFTEIFGEVTLKELITIEKSFNIRLRTGVVESVIKEIFDDFVEDFKLDFKDVKQN